jgi:hypothetical protein
MLRPTIARRASMSDNTLFHRPPDVHHEEAAMPIIKIDDKDYDFDQLSDNAKAQLASLQFVDAELQRIAAQTAVLQTARMAYAKALSEALPAGAGTVLN